MGIVWGLYHWSFPSLHSCTILSLSLFSYPAILLPSSIIPEESPSQITDLISTLKQYHIIQTRPSISDQNEKKNHDNNMHEYKESQQGLIPLGKVSYINSKFQRINHLNKTIPGIAHISQYQFQ